eukprot:SAG31_NODE_2954_length_4863_cov_34.043451_4_plen_130_part_00
MHVVLQSRRLALAKCCHRRLGEDALLVDVDVIAKIGQLVVPQSLLTRDETATWTPPKLPPVSNYTAGQQTTPLRRLALQTLQPEASDEDVRASKASDAIANAIVAVSESLSATKSGHGENRRLKEDYYY